MMGLACRRWASLEGGREEFGILSCEGGHARFKYLDKEKDIAIARDVMHQTVLLNIITYFGLNTCIGALFSTP